MRLAGIYVHGALVLIMTFCLGLHTGNHFVCVLAAASSGLAYLAEFIYCELYLAGKQVTQNQARFHMGVVYSSITTGVLSFLVLVNNLWLVN